MKSTPAPQFSEIRGSIGSVCVQKRKTGFAISKKPIPYSISGEERSNFQKEVNTCYGAAVAVWRDATQAQRNAWETSGAEIAISGFNYLVWVSCRLPPDRGLTWTLIQRLGTEIYVYSLVNLGGGVVLAGTGPTGQIYRTTDAGLTWSLIQRLGTETNVRSLINLGGGVALAGTYPTGQIWRSEA